MPYNEMTADEEEGEARQEGKKCDENKNMTDKDVERTL